MVHQYYPIPISAERFEVFMPLSAEIVGVTKAIKNMNTPDNIVVLHVLAEASGSHSRFFRTMQPFSTQQLSPLEVLLPIGASS